MGFFFRSGYVWYACYGSNISRKRFLKYIEGCLDSTPPVEDRPFEFSYDIYFAKKAKTWDGCGKAFLDITAKGHAYGRIYKITRDQYMHVKAQEGPDYRKQVCLGKVDGLPVYSFTDTQRNSEIRMPSYRYYQVILDGLKECCTHMEKAQLGRYLNSRVMPEEHFEILKALQKSGNGLSCQQLTDRTRMDSGKVTEILTWLQEKEVIEKRQEPGQEETFRVKEGPAGSRLIVAMIEAVKE